MSGSIVNNDISPASTNEELMERLRQCQEKSRLLKVASDAIVQKMHAEAVAKAVQAAENKKNGLEKKANNLYNKRVTSFLTTSTRQDMVDMVATDEVVSLLRSFTLKVRDNRSVPEAHLLHQTTLTYMNRDGITADENTVVINDGHSTNVFDCISTISTELADNLEGVIAMDKKGITTFSYVPAGNAGGLVTPGPVQLMRFDAVISTLTFANNFGPNAKENKTAVEARDKSIALILHNKKPISHFIGAAVGKLATRFEMYKVQPSYQITTSTLNDGEFIPENEIAMKKTKATPPSNDSTPVDNGLSAEQLDKLAGDAEFNDSDDENIRQDAAETANKVAAGAVSHHGLSDSDSDSDEEEEEEEEPVEEPEEEPERDPTPPPTKRTTRASVKASPVKKQKM
jgi:hypothetical protein